MGSLLRRTQRRQVSFLLWLVSLSCGVHPDPPSESSALQPALWILDSAFLRSWRPAFGQFLPFPNLRLLRLLREMSSTGSGLLACEDDAGPVEAASALAVKGAPSVSAAPWGEEDG